VSVFVDTSALIAHLDVDDPRNGQAQATLDSLSRTDDLVTTNYVQVEALAVARRRLGRAAGAALIEALFPILNTVWVDSRVHALALAMYREGNNAASLVDHVSFVVMRQLGIQDVFAFDGDFVTQGFRAVITPRTRGVHEVSPAYGEAASATELVSVSEISARAGRPINTIQSWRRRHADFPAPIAQLAAGPIWEWPDVSRWIGGRRARSQTDRTP